MAILDMLFILISKSTTHLALAKAAPRGLERSLDVVACVQGGITERFWTGNAPLYRPCRVQT